MLEGELGAAVAAGAPLAMLTVSESTLYGRYGFAPAAASASWRIETKRAAWIGPRPDGRVDFITRERLRELVAPMHERVRLRVAGEIDVPGGFWDGFAGTNPTAEKPGEKRAVQYADADGEVRGLAIYSVKENHDDFTKASVNVAYLLAETDDAYAALWRFLLELDLVAEVNAGELSVDEPLRWMIADQRAATVTLRDHQYVRILDVPTALEARRYGAPGTLALDVSDALGHAGGRFVLTVDGDGHGTVSSWDDGAAAPDGSVEVALGIEELSAAYLGGVSLATLAAAGRVRSTDASPAARVFAWHTAPASASGTDPSARRRRHPRTHGCRRSPSLEGTWHIFWGPRPCTWSSRPRSSSTASHSGSTRATASASSAATATASRVCSRCSQVGCSPTRAG
nr:hypothetical protein GCM10025699_33980 [Microbacterium flavescens]